MGYQAMSETSLRATGANGKSSGTPLQTKLVRRLPLGSWKTSASLSRKGNFQVTLPACFMALACPNMQCGSNPVSS